AWATFVLAVLASLPLLVVSRRSLAGRVLVVRAPEAAVRSEPRLELEAIASAPAGAEARRLDELGGWTRIELDDGTRGWVKSDALFPLDPFRSERPDGGAK
ncbi:MAG TPA: SH3 domain-containing protein, partial [Planctomycetes bacterium]|nr:SH3 domain-containing protein [Planctomycetota bacterium]